jgi:hypothetical protein
MPAVASRAIPMDANWTNGAQSRQITSQKVFRIPDV